MASRDSSITGRRAFLGSALAIACGSAWPQQPPPLRLLVGLASGSVMDVAARQIADAYTAQTGQAVVVDNRPSAGGIIALDVLRQAPPDGRTLCIVNAMQMTAASALFPSLPYDPMRDFTHVGILFIGPQVLAVSAALPVHSWSDLVAFAKARPESLRYSTSAVGSPQHLSMELVRITTGMNLQHIAYRGGPAEVQAAVAGQVEMTLEGAALLLPQIRAGRLTALAVGGEKRLTALPDVPTFAELGVPGIAGIWVGLVAPRGLPAQTRDNLQSAMSRAVLALRADYEAIGRVVEPGTGDAMTESIRAQTPVWRDLIQRAGIRVE